MADTRKRCGLPCLEDQGLIMLAKALDFPSPCRYMVSAANYDKLLAISEQTLERRRDAGSNARPALETWDHLRSND